MAENQRLIAIHETKEREHEWKKLKAHHTTSGIGKKYNIFTLLNTI